MSDPDPRATALAKIGHARDLRAELHSRYAAWAKSTDLNNFVVTIDDDRCGWQVRLPDFAGPPVDKWRLILGDAVHNVRSALDHLVWAHADTEGLTEGQQSLLSFPILRKRGEWKKKATMLGEAAKLPPGMVERIAAVQPFQRPQGEVETDALVLLQYLDNMDKHRLPLEVLLHPQVVDASALVEYADEAAAEAAGPPAVNLYDHTLEPSALVLSGRTTRPIVRVRRASYAAGLQLCLHTPRGPLGAGEAVDRLADYASDVIAYVTDREVGS